MPAKLTLHPPQRASRFLVIRDQETLVVGRDTDCDLVLEDACVSKRHARLRWTGAGWTLDDLGSKNGTSVNGRPADAAELSDGDWVSFGGLMGRFQRISEEDARELHAERFARLQTSVELRRRLGARLEPFDLLLKFLESTMEVVDAERGFVLVAGEDGALRVEVAAGFGSEQVDEERFEGSLGAVEKVLATRSSIIVSDAQRDPFLGGRESVVRRGLGTLACVPLLNEGRLLGLLYLDSRKPGAGMSELDVEILEALAEHTALVIAGLHLDQRIRRVLQEPRGRAGDAGVLDHLTRRIAERASGTAAPPLGGSGG